MNASTVGRRPWPSPTQGGQPRVGFGFTIANGRIVGIELSADPDRLRQLELAILSD